MYSKKTSLLISESQMLSTSVEGIFFCDFLEKRHIEIPISSIQFRKLQSVKKTYLIICTPSYICFVSVFPFYIREVLLFYKKNCML